MFQIQRPVFSDTTTAPLDDLTSEALDTSFVQGQDDEGDGSEESDSELNLTDNEERPESADLEPIADTTVTDTAGTTSSSGTEKKNGKGRLVVKPHQKRGATRSQTQALGNLASGVNKMADIQSKRLKIQEESEKSRKKERESLLEFRREEAERNRQHELKLAEMYMRILSAPVPAPQPQFAMPSQNQIATWPNATYFLPNSPPTLNTPPTRRQQNAAEHCGQLGTLSQKTSCNKALPYLCFYFIFTSFYLSYLCFYFIVTSFYMSYCIFTRYCHIMFCFNLLLLYLPNYTLFL